MTGTTMTYSRLMKVSEVMDHKTSIFVNKPQVKLLSLAHKALKYVPVMSVASHYRYLLEQA
jgi:hypothetical protein